MMLMMKRSRTWRSFAIAALFLSGMSCLSASAFAKEDKKKDAAPKGGLMEEGRKDPAQTETMDEDGQFVPGKKKKQPPRGEGADEEGGEAAGAEGDSDKKEKEPEPEKKKKPVKLRKTIGVFGEALIGFGDGAPQPGPNDPTTGKATTFGFLLGGHYDVSTEMRLMLRVPWTTGTIQDQNHLPKSSNALGVPELAARYRLSEPGNTEWAVRVAVGVPVAQGNPDVTDNVDAVGQGQAKVQRFADAANGWHDQELYAMKRMPVSPALLFTYRDEKLRLGSELKAVFLPKIGGSIKQPNPTEGTYEMKGLGLTVLLGGSASYEVLERKFLALAAWASYQVTPTVDFTSSASVTKPSPFQLVLEPKILAQFGHFVPSVGFLIPVGGQLGGHINGVRFRIDAVF